MYLGLVAHASLDLQRRVAREISPGRHDVSISMSIRAVATSRGEGGLSGVVRCRVPVLASIYM